MDLYSSPDICIFCLSAHIFFYFLLPVHLNHGTYGNDFNLINVKKEKLVGSCYFHLCLEKVSKKQY